MSAARVNCFNSKMVRLQAKRAKSRRLAAKVFQFQNGTIKRVSGVG